MQDSARCRICRICRIVISWRSVPLPCWQYMAILELWGLVLNHQLIMDTNNSSCCLQKKGRRWIVSGNVSLKYVEILCRSPWSAKKKMLQGKSWTTIGRNQTHVRPPDWPCQKGHQHHRQHQCHHRQLHHHRHHISRKKQEPLNLSKRDLTRYEGL